jgi:hypothetical protein
MDQRTTLHGGRGDMTAAAAEAQACVHAGRRLFERRSRGRERRSSRLGALCRSYFFLFAFLVFLVGP